ncbi:MAG: magnesium transporter [Novosphingobium lindaniclasticum]|jgi:magnesium transporter|uniref:Magnesium transporter MgtE n=1 Tax=Novosphingobium lindaniclasticum LE124 TaxID=1096930 RepID=T0HHP5_9SPHN|nr:magnesium transporter [Novosphingobium lindaniclasticum]EQB15811.1 magnesium transporter [Novosphingobium lindaniclasticum LE124]MDF2639300.1 magnesium transporter [Novosphingobium lindaniclasticum]
MSETDLQHDPAEQAEDTARLDVPESESLDDDNRLKAEFVRSVKDALDDEDFERVYDLVEPLHPADIADLFELVDENERLGLARAIRDLMGVEVIAEMNDWVREALMEALPAEVVAEIAEQLDTDDAVAMLEDLDEEDQQAVLAEMEPEDRAAIETALSYPEESAGRLMSRDFVAVHESMTVGDLIDFLREHRELPTEFWEVFIVDPMHRPIGTCALSWILRTPRNIPLYDVMARDQTLIPADMDQEEVALRFQKYALISAAVVDEAGRLIGQITVDDIVHIIQEEAGEDTLLLSGAGDGDINEPIRDAYSARVRWLIANLLTATLASSVIAMFEGTISKMVALATLMPIVAGLGGNAGTQTLAVTVRALATNQLTASNAWRAVRREMSIALLNGCTVAVVIGIVVSLIFGNVTLGLVIAMAMMTNILIAGMAGVFVPLTLERFKADPAIASSIFVTMTTDSMGFLVFLGLATVSGLVG